MKDNTTETNMNTIDTNDLATVQGGQAGGDPPPGGDPGVGTPGGWVPSCLLDETCKFDQQGALRFPNGREVEPPPGIGKNFNK